MTDRSNRFPVALAFLLAAYACARILESTHNPLPSIAIVALDVLSAMAFALIDGARHYRLRGILVFAGLCIVVGNVTENLSIATGFPFGHYYFASLMGPKLFQVPVLLGLAYIGMAYVSWMLGAAIVGRSPASATGARILAVPLTASFIMVAWDLAQDPVWGTVLHGWVWRDGGLWFGVPISNYLGWYANVFTIYLLFAIYLRRSTAPRHPKPRPTARPAILFYALCATGNVLQIFYKADPAVVQDPAGHTWRVADITGASALVSIFVMGAFAFLAWIRFDGQRGVEADSTDYSP